MTSRLRDLPGFARAQWPVILAAPVMLLVFTILHEAAHGAAVWVQGGTITQFVILPSGGRWGHVAYEFPADTAYSSFAIAIAPYVFWTAVCTTAAALSTRSRPFAAWAAGCVFVWMYIAPAADIMNAWLPWLRGSRNDFHSAWGPPTTYDAWIVAVAVLTWTMLGFGVQRRLYGERALSVPLYAAGVGVLLLIGAAYFLLR